MARFSSELYDLAMAEKEVELTTFGRKSGEPSRRILWIWGGDGRVYVRSGQGLGRDWPRNLLATDGRAVLHLAGRDVPVRARHVADPVEARAGAGMIDRKYASGTTPSPEGGPLSPGEQATFELTPDDARP